jgi:hypothetical protein
MPSKIAKFFLLSRETKPKLIYSIWIVVGFAMMILDQQFGLTNESAAGVWFLLGFICAWAFGSISTLALEIENLKAKIEPANALNEIAKEDKR